jgi:hypothetical protein
VTRNTQHQGSTADSSHSRALTREEYGGDKKFLAYDDQPYGGFRA